MIDVTIDNRLRLQRDAVSTDVAKKLREAFTYKNPQHAKLVAMGQRYNKEPKIYELWQEDGEELSLPRGGMQKLRDIFDDEDLDYQVIDNRSRGAPHITGSFIDPWQLGGDLFPEHKLVPWEHQTEMVEAADKYGQILMRAPTGSGKTSAILKHIAKAQVPAIVIMWDAGLLEKTWQPRIEEELGIPVKEQGLIRGSTFRLKPITLAMQQTLARWDEKKWARLFFDNQVNGLTQCIFASVYCDEVQRYSARTFVEFINRLDCHNRIGVTADERRKDRKTFIIYDMFGKVKHEVKKQTLVDKRIIHEVECYVIPTEFQAEWYRLKKEDDILELADSKRLLEEMQNDDKRNELAVHLIEECVKAGLPTLSFTQYVDHARKIDVALIARGIASGLALGGKEWEKTFSETLDQLRDGKLQVGCGTYGKLGVGHDIPAVAAGIAVTPVHNNRGFLGQVKGRICRTTQGKENARILVLWDRLVFGDLPLFNLKRWNEVCKVWDEWDCRWKEIGDYMKETRYGNRHGTTTTAAEADDIFINANAVPANKR